MLRRGVLAFLIIGALGEPLRAQERFPVRLVMPTTWTSLSIGLYRLPIIFDPSSNSDWDFGSIVQFRATFERDFQRSAALGVAATYARAPLTYDGPDCGFCDADVSMWQALALFRIGAGGTVRFQQVIEFAAGATGFSNFQARDGGRLAAGTVVDPTLSIGYGFAYAFAPSTQFTLVQEVGLMLHRRGTRPAGDESNTPTTYATRIGLRFGLGKPR
jgi:hypothetical protein